MSVCLDGIVMRARAANKLDRELPPPVQVRVHGTERRGRGGQGDAVVVRARLPGKSINKFPVFNPLPTLLGHAPIGCAEAPEIAPEAPGYRC